VLRQRTGKGTIAQNREFGCRRDGDPVRNFRKRDQAFQRVITVGALLAQMQKQIDFGRGVDPYAPASISAQPPKAATASSPHCSRLIEMLPFLDPAIAKIIQDIRAVWIELKCRLKIALRVVPAIRPLKRNTPRVVKRG